MQRETRDRLDREARRRQRELDTGSVEVAARKAAVQRVYRAQLDRVGRIFVAIDSRLNPEPEV